MRIPRMLLLCHLVFIHTSMNLEKTAWISDTHIVHTLCVCSPEQHLFLVLSQTKLYSMSGGGNYYCKKTQMQKCKLCFQPQYIHSCYSQTVELICPSELPPNMSCVINSVDYSLIYLNVLGCSRQSNNVNMCLFSFIS